MIVCGIDPGVEPTICMVHDPRADLIEFYEGPQLSTEYTVNGRQRKAPHAILVKKVMEHWSPSLVIIEDVWVMPKQGAVSGARLVAAAYLIAGICHGLSLRTVMVRPQKWKQLFALNKQPKDMSRARVLQLWPNQAGYFQRKKDHNRAEAFLLAMWGWTMYFGNQHNLDPMRSRMMDKKLEELIDI